MSGRDGVTYLTSLGLERILENGTAQSGSAGTAGQFLMSGGSSGPMTWASMSSATIGLASSSATGLMGIGTQTFAGDKTFLGITGISAAAAVPFTVTRSGSGSAVGLRLINTDGSVFLGMDSGENFEIRETNNAGTVWLAITKATGAVALGAASSTATNQFNGRLDVVDGGTRAARIDIASSVAFLELGGGFGSAYEGWLSLGRTDSVMKLVSGSTDTSDPGIWIYGDTHATLAGDILFKSSAGATVASYDLSATTWAFAGSAFNFNATGTNITTIATTGSNSSSIIDIQIADTATTADPSIRFRNATFGTTGWIIGKDTSDSSAFKISQASGFSSGNNFFAITTGGVVTLSSVLAITQNENTTLDGAIAALGSTSTYRKLSDADAKDLQGITAGTSGQIMILQNTGGTLTVRNLSASASAGNKIVTGTGADLTITGDGVVTFIYDGAGSQWVVVSSNA